jgi:hypothetical protein
MQADIQVSWEKGFLILEIDEMSGYGFSIHRGVADMLLPCA